MKEQLISLLVSKVGLDQQKAEESVNAVLNYIKNNPQQVTSYLEGTGLGNIAGTLGNMLGK
ncbi:MAG: hypothetical protein L0229_02345 [Blastocatellia bacterium]|nr:hypothetical protein [Blastocatellia bacterium]